MASNDFIVDLYDLENIIEENDNINNSVFPVIRMFFLKYVIDNLVGANSIEEVKLYKHLESSLKYGSIGGPNPLYPVINCVCNKYNLQEFKNTMMTAYCKELYGYDYENGLTPIEGQREVYDKLMTRLSQINMLQNETEKGNSHLLNLLVYLDDNAKKSRSIRNSISGLSLACFVRKILELKDGMRFADYMSGAGLSTFIIAHSTENCVVENYDVDEEYLMISAMLCIMSGRENFIVKKRDIFNRYDRVDKVDRIFIDPQGVDNFNTEICEKEDDVVVAIETAINQLNDGGRAIISVPTNFLFKSSKAYSMVRERLMIQNVLSTVISMPISEYGKTSKINLLVIEKTPNNNVFFANGNSRDLLVWNRENEEDTNILEYEEIDRLANIVKNKIKVEGISTFASVDKVKENSFNLMPTTYVKENYYSDGNSMEEINEQIKQLYKKFIELQ